MVISKSMLFISSLIYFALTTTSISLASMDLHKKYVTECGYTRFPGLCIKTLKKLASDDPRPDIISVLMNVTISETSLHVSNFEALLVDHFTSEDAQNTQELIGYCNELTRLSLERLSQALVALRESPTRNKPDLQTWISAAITFQETCKDRAEPHATSNTQMDQIFKKMVYLSQLGSNLLALTNRITTNTTKRHHGPAKDGEFPGWVPGRQRKLLQGDPINVNVVVAKDGTGHYGTISEAIQAAWGSRFVIYVKAGVYQEKIHCKKDGITLVGDGKYSTIITGDNSVAGGSALQATATFTITGDGFIAKDIGFQNTAGSQAEQAIAVLVASDHAVFYRCALIGYQDTLYALSLRQFYRECDIYGTVDFIFGNAAAVFQNCILVLRRPRGHGAYNVILANGRTDPGQNTGLSVHNCRIIVGTDLYPFRYSFNSYLGRPWKQYSRAVVMQSVIDDAIAVRGWVEWPVDPTSSLRTLFFAEYGNTGPKALTYGRVKWPGFHVLVREDAVRYTVGNFIGGESWLPSTGVTFISGLQ